MTASKRKRAIPIIGKIAKLQLQKGDTLCLFSKHPMSQRQHEHIIEELVAHFPGHKILVIDESMSLSVIAGATA